MPETYYLHQILILLGAVVITVPILQRLGFGAVLGYIIAGAIIGPWGVGLIHETGDIQKIAEFGVIFLLFLIGIELKPAYLWSMRRLVFGLGTAQVLITGFLLTLVAILIGIDHKAAVIIGFGLALSSTAFGLQILNERRQVNTAFGRAAISVLLLQDLAVVPLLALVSLLSGEHSLASGVEFALLQGLAVIMIILLIGRYLLPPLLHLVASSRSTEIFIAGALFSVLGIALLMEQAGLSMALGAFLAGLMLAESHFRHQIVADILPFRAVLLGLFFMSVGMSINFGLLAEQFLFIAAVVLVLMWIKIAVLLGLNHLFRLDLSDNVRTAFLLSQSGEFAFILFGLAATEGLITPNRFQILILIVAVTMALTPLMVNLMEFIDRRFISRTYKHPISELDLQAQEHEVIIAGFGRVGRRIAKLLDVCEVPYIALDLKPDRIAKFRAQGIPVYYGDASRLDVLKATGADQARVLVITMVDQDVTERLVHLVRQHYPDLAIYSRAHDHEHCRRLLDAGANLAISETMEASLQLANATLETAGLPQHEIDQLLKEFRMKYYTDDPL